MLLSEIGYFETGNLGNEALIVMKDKTVYALGNNVAGCLGTGDSHSTLYPKKVESLCKKNIKTFTYGSGPHVLALTEDGEVGRAILLQKCLNQCFRKLTIARYKLFS